VPISLGLYLYMLYQKKIEASFDKNNKVLSQKEIEELLKKDDFLRTLRIFRSAVVDHKKIDEMPYYLSYPVNGIFHHDGFKRAVIADGIADYAREFKEDELSEALLILDKLIDPETSISYVQILAWHSLGKIGKSYKTLVKDKKETIMKAFGASVASVLGVLLFLDKMLQTSQRRRALAFIKEGSTFTKYRVQKALINYYMFKSPYFSNPLDGDLNLGSDIKRFLLSNRSWTQSDTNQGLRHLGIIKWNQEAYFWDNTPHTDVARRIKKAANNYIAPIGAFSSGNE
jgi:hypothetical protein